MHTGNRVRGRLRAVVGHEPGVSPKSFTMGCAIPLDFSMSVWVPRRREAATIFMAFVIFAMLPTDFIRCFTARRRILKRSE